MNDFWNSVTFENLEGIFIFPRQTVQTKYLLVNPVKDQI